MSQTPAEANTGLVHGMSREYPDPGYDMGFSIDGIPIPNPAVFTGAESDLDTMGERDATGYLHRNRVATKHPLKIEYHNISWNLIMDICPLLRKDKFTFTFPSPFRGGFQTIDAYVGDREFECVWKPFGHVGIGNLSFSVIEY